MTRYSGLAGLTLVLGLLAPAAHASTRIALQIGVPVVVAPIAVAPAAYSGFIWQPGYYVWIGFGRRWVPGAWIRPAYGRPGWFRERWGYERRGWDRDRRWERNRWREREWRR
jgi:hypothetical protein